MNGICGAQGSSYQISSKHHPNYLSVNILVTEKQIQELALLLAYLQLNFIKFKGWVCL